jgi:hypothetical protein
MIKYNILHCPNTLPDDYDYDLLVATSSRRRRYRESNDIPGEQIVKRKE